MKKIITVLVIISGLLFGSNQVKAQTKIGYMSVDQMVSLMPEAVKIDSLLKKYQEDSLNATINLLVQDYGYKDSMLNKNPDSLKIPAVTRAQYRRDLDNLAYQIQNWQSITQQAIQNKQDQLLAPIYNKVITALRNVAKEKGYTYVMSKDAFLVAPDGDDLLPLVATRLGVKLPANMSQKTGPK
jgi:outer membrane protein